jgi:LmbE family N-acetylglucosaminyl deacetylase
MNRREMLKGAGGLAGAATLRVEEESAKAAEPPPRKLKIVVTGGHPGDPEYGCGGTVARLTAAGHEVVLLYLNDGAWETSAAVRTAEAKRACEILKARPVYANQTNGHAVVDGAHYDAFEKIIAAENPDAVFSQWLVDNHPDHRATANLTYESWNRLKRRFALYYYEVSDGEDTMQFPAPTHYVDITGVAEAKRAACYAHASQNPDFFYGLQDTVALFRGFAAGCKRAEAYVMQIRSPHNIFASTDLYLL